MRKTIFFAVRGTFHKMEQKELFVYKKTLDKSIRR